VKNASNVLVFPVETQSTSIIVGFLATPSFLSIPFLNPPSNTAWIARLVTLPAQYSGSVISKSPI
jgi:hypothetical protein